MSESVINQGNQLRTAFKKHDNWLVITGAGISAASGIPTYRDANGDWMRSDPIKHQEFIKQPDKRGRYWARSVVGWPPVADAAPNDAHVALVELEKNGRLTGLITQNVDRLHQRAGHQRVVDLHGRLDRVTCLDCENIFSRNALQERLLDANPFLQDYLREGTTYQAQLAPDGDAFVEDKVTEMMSVPSCEKCGGTLMPDVVFFGGTLKPEIRLASQQLFDASKGLLVVGSSLTVFSAFRFCRQAAAAGKPLIIISQGKTRADDLATTKLTLDCSEALQMLL